jgi:hypothetical protein
LEAAAFKSTAATTAMRLKNATTIALQQNRLKAMLWKPLSVMVLVFSIHLHPTVLAEK